jgi:hypothetical protein
LLGFDLNRVWNEPSHWAHPEIYGIKTHIMNLNEDAVSSKFPMKTKNSLFFSRILNWIFLLISTLIQLWWTVLCMEMSTKMLIDSKNTASFLDYYLVMRKIFRLIILHSIEMLWKLEPVDGKISLSQQFYFHFYFHRTLGGCLQDSTHCYTLEVSFFSYQTSTNSQAIPYTEELCKTFFQKKFFLN